MKKWLDQYKNGGNINSLNRKVTCSNCGWSWKLSDGGLDPMTCHKCGGDIKMQNGGELDEYQYKGEYKGQVPVSDVMQNRVPIGIQQIPIDPFTHQPLTREQIQMQRFVPYSNKPQPIISQGTWSGNRKTKDVNYDPYSRIIEKDPQSEANIGKRMRKELITKKVPAGVTAAAAIMAAPLAAPIVSSAMSAPLTIGATTVPWVTPTTVIGAGFGLSGANKLNNDLASNYYTNPNISKFEKGIRGFETGLDLLGTPGVVEAIGTHLIAPAYRGALGAGEYLTTQTPLKNTYKINPLALKENPEMFLYRARPVGQDVNMNMAAQLRAKQAAGEPLTWYQKNLLNPQTNPQLLAREKYYGKWFEKDPSRLDFYINPGTRNFADDEAIEILRTRLPKAEAAKLNVSQFPDAKVLSASPETEFILPKNMISSAEKFPESSWQELIQQDKAFNTPHWLKGYGKKSNLKVFTEGQPYENISLVNIGKNLEDLQAAKKFAKQYGYELPEGLERIAESDILTDRTIRGLMDRHNTFVRGVSTNWEEIGKRNPEILRHLEGKGFNLSTKEGTKAAAEYMSTHIPINTGYGRASLNNNVFERGLDGLYTSNSIPTAEGYTYGQGYITKVKRPTNFSSTNRQDWINENNPTYYDERLPENINSSGLDEVYQNTVNNIKEDKPFIINGIQVKKEGNSFFYRNLNNSKWDKIDAEDYDNFKNMAIDAFNENKKQKLLKTEHKPGFFGENFGDFGNSAEEISAALSKSSTEQKIHSDNLLNIVKEIGKKQNKEIANLLDQQENLINKTTRTAQENEELKTLENKIRDLRWSGQNEVFQKESEYLSKHFPGWEDKKNMYAHYIHLGTPGEKVLQPIKSWEITPEIWKNKSRAHTNYYTNKLSGMSKGGPIVTNRGQWDYPGQTTIIPSNQITMQGVPYPVVGVDNTGHTKIMQPGMDYTFPGQYVTEYPMMQGGGQMSIQDIKNAYKTAAYNYNNRIFPKETLQKRQAAYNTINPTDYTDLRNYGRWLSDEQRDVYSDPRSEEAWKFYLGLNKPEDLRYLRKSKYRPTINATQKNYYSVDPDLEQDLFNAYKDKVELNKTLQTDESELETPLSGDSGVSMLGRFGVSRGQDENGDYLSYYDKYDLKDFAQKRTKGVPYSIYGRIYYPKKEQGGEMISDYKSGGQHGGLDRWFAEKWVDIKTGRPCGRQEGESRNGYPACRPSKRISSDTPKTSSELSSSERERFKREKTSSERISYNHQRREDGGEILNLELMKSGGNVATNPSLWSRAKLLARQKYDVYPSAYANGWAAKWYKSHGGGWRKAEYGMEVMGDGGVPNNPGFNSLPEYVQQNIINNMATGGQKMPPQLAYARFAAAGNLNQLQDYGYEQGGVVLNAGGEKHRIYVKSTNRGEGAKGHIMVNHPTMDKGMWDTIDLTEKAGATTIAQGVAATKKWHRENPYKKQEGGEKEEYWRTKKPMVNDPSMDAISKVLLQRNLGKNFMQRAAGFGYQGGIPTRYIPGEDPDSDAVSTLLMSFGDNQVFPTIIQTGPEQLSYQPYQTQEYLEAPTWDVADYFAAKGYKRAANDMYGMEYKNGGYVVRRSHDRKGKTHVVIGPDGTKKYFGDPNMGERGKSKYGKEAFYARHKKNLAKNPYFRAYARATWEEGGETYAIGGQSTLNPIVKKDNRNWLDYLKN